MYFKKSLPTTLRKFPGTCQKKIWDNTFKAWEKMEHFLEIWIYGKSETALQNVDFS